MLSRWRGGEASGVPVLVLGAVNRMLNRLIALYLASQIIRRQAMRAAGETNQIGRAPYGTSLDRHPATLVRKG